MERGHGVGAEPDLWGSCKTKDMHGLPLSHFLWEMYAAAALKSCVGSHKVQHVLSFNGMLEDVERDPCLFLAIPLLSLSFVMAQPPVPCTVTFAVVHPHGPLMTNTGGKVAGVGAVLLVGLEIGGHACVCHLCCCCVQDLGVCWNC